MQYYGETIQYDVDSSLLIVIYNDKNNMQEEWTYIDFKAVGEVFVE